MKKWIINLVVACLIIIPITIYLVIPGTLQIYDAMQSNGFCSREGFEYSVIYTNDNEKDYFACCNDIYINHMRTNKICKSFKLELLRE